MTDPGVELLRILRRDRYRCQHELSRGRICARLGSNVARQHGEDVTVCAAHAAEVATESATD